MNKQADQTGYIKNSGSKLIFEMEMKKYNVKGSELFDLLQKDGLPMVGDQVFYENKPAPNGKYHLGFLNPIHVKHGIVSKFDYFFDFRVFAKLSYFWGCDCFSFTHEHLYF